MAKKEKKLEVKEKTTKKKETKKAEIQAENIGLLEQKHPYF